MKAKDRFVYLSDKSLTACWGWAEANEATPLGEAYMAACRGVSDWSVGKIASQVSPYRNGERGWSSAYRAADKARNFSFMCRDTLGRLILAEIKKAAPPNSSEDRPAAPVGDVTE